MSVTGSSVVRSVTATARRAQIVTATAEVVAEVGLAQASFARIAAHAGLSSTRLISYHFADKDELIGAVAADVIADISRYVGTRVGAERTAAGRLRAYIESTVAFIDANRLRMTALLDIVLTGGLQHAGDSDAVATSHLEEILRQGVAAGELRDLDPRAVGVAVQRAVEGLPFLLRSRPDLDCAAYGRELVTLFELGTRRAG